MSAYDKYQQAWGIEGGLRAGKAFLDRFVPRVLGNPLVRGALNNPIVRVGGGLASKAFSLPAQIVVSELAQTNPWGNKDSAMYGKGPGSLEYATAIERANAAGRSTPIEEDYLATPPITTDVAVAPTVNQKVDGFLSTNFLGGLLPKTSSSQPQISNIGVTPKEFQVGGKYGPSEEALIDLADQATLVNNQGEYIGGVLPEGDGIDHRATWLHKTRNSPAARSGSFTDEDRWQTHLANQQWRKDQGRSYKHGEFLN